MIIIPFSKKNQTKIEPEVWKLGKLTDIANQNRKGYLFQLNCLIAEINVQRLLIKENFKK